MKYLDASSCVVSYPDDWPAPIVRNGPGNACKITWDNGTQILIVGNLVPLVKWGNVVTESFVEVKEILTKVLRAWCNGRILYRDTLHLTPYGNDAFEILSLSQVA